MRSTVSLIVIALVGSAFLSPRQVEANDYVEQCGSVVLSTCASVSAVFENGQLTITAYNTSTGYSGSSVLTTLLLRVNGGSGASLASVNAYRGDESWDLTDRFELTEGQSVRNVQNGGWNIEINATNPNRNGPGKSNGNSSGGRAGACVGIVNPDEAGDLPCGPNGQHFDKIEYVIDFSDGQNYELLAWAFHSQNISGEPGSDWTTEVVPEPITLILFGSGLAGVGGIGWVRRRRRGRDELEA